MYTIVIILVIAYICWKIKEMRHEVLKGVQRREESKKPIEVKPYWCPIRKELIGREREYETIPLEKSELEKDVANVYNSIAAQIQANVSSETNEENEKGIALGEEEHVEEFQHAFAPDETYRIPFPDDMDVPDYIPEEMMMGTYMLPQEEISEAPEGIKYPDETSVMPENINPLGMSWYGVVIGREKQYTRILNQGDQQRYWIDTQGEILPENRMLCMQIHIDKPYSYRLLDWKFVEETIDN
ncbi:MULTISPECIES: transposase [unclassified Bacillus (in: firmicutes)]|uniref:transposase n=1 Tax=unclassified Bacillus (in: firmicutes) TaxID=185979 RepID=UPI000BF2F62C|nr:MULTISPECIES: transposase [unclassified Bacillus (in: firmicutes)]PEU19217.1 transposase [Bacillus sp. AFS014408]PFW61630.1 transposase [Bacillus sp. AFS075034]